MSWAMGCAPCSWTRATRSKRRWRRNVRYSPNRGPASAHCACAWACTPEPRKRTNQAMSPISRLHGRSASPTRDMAARPCCRRQPRARCGRCCRPARRCAISVRTSCAASPSPRRFASSCARTCRPNFLRFAPRPRLRRHLRSSFADSSSAAAAKSCCYGSTGTRRNRRADSWCCCRASRAWARPGWRRS